MPVDHKRRDEAIKRIKKIRDDALDFDENLGFVSTGSYAVDIITKIGGFPRGRLTEVAGPFSSGKTTLCLTAFAAAQRLGLYPVYFDLERALDRQHAEHLGCDFTDTSKGLFAMPGTAEEALKMADEMIQIGADLIIFDSVAAMISDKELEGEIGDVAPMAIRARVLSKELPRLIVDLQKQKTAVVLINQLRSTMDTGFRAQRSEETTGGFALKYYTSLRLHLRQTKKSAQTRKTIDVLGKEREVPLASIHEAEAIKSKIGAPLGKIEFVIRFDDERQVFGIDNVLTLLDAAKTQGILDKKGAWIYYGEEKWQGDAALYDHAFRTPEFTRALREELVKRGILKWLQPGA